MVSGQNIGGPQRHRWIHRIIDGNTRGDAAEQTGKPQSGQ